MLTIREADEQYGVTVEHAEGAVFTVKGFILTGVHMASALFFKIQEPGGKGVPGLHVRITNGGENISNPTKEDGITDMGVGGGSWYDPTDGQSGPHCAEVMEGPSDRVCGLGYWDDHQSLITVWQGENGMTEPYELVDFSELNMHTHFREAGVQVDEGTKYGVTHLIAKGGGDKPFPFRVRVLKKNGVPAPGVILKLKKHGGAGGVWPYTTDEDGYTTIFMDDDFKYAVPGKPKYCIHVGKGMGGSDVIAFGWVAGERRWFDVVLQARGEKPERPVLSNLEVSAIEFYVVIASEGADSRHYTLDGPDYHKEGEAGESALYVSDLQASTRYTLKVWGRNAAGDGPDAELEFTTLDEDERPASPENLRVAYTTRTTLSIGWDTSAGATVYRVETDGHEYSTDLASYTVAGLLPDTTYTVSVAAGNEHGWSEWSTTSGKTQPESENGCRCAAELEELEIKLDQIKGVVDIIKEGQDELAAFIQQKMTVAAEELPKVVAELERIDGECCDGE